MPEHADAYDLILRLNDLLRGEGITVESIRMKEARLARRLGVGAPSRDELVALRDLGSGAALPDGTRVLPMRVGRRCIGAMRISRSADSDLLGPDDLSFLESVAAGVAEIVSRGALREDALDAARERAVAEERGRIAIDLHDSAGQIFIAINLLARHKADELPSDSPWRQHFNRLAELAQEGKWEINRAVEALTFFPAARRGLAPSVQALAESFQADSGIDVVVDVSGEPTRLAPRVEKALYRVFHEALMNAWRHAHCKAIRAELTFGSDEITLTAVDDGVGLLAGSRAAGPRVGTASMRRAMEEVGGAFRIRNIKPTGVRVDASVPRSSR